MMIRVRELKKEVISLFKGVSSCVLCFGTAATVVSDMTSCYDFHRPALPSGPAAKIGIFPIKRISAIKPFQVLPALSLYEEAATLKPISRIVSGAMI